MLVDIIAGTRPNFVKIATILHAFTTQFPIDGEVKYRLIHTGQHYDARMSDDFFDQLEIQSPNFNLNVGSGTQAEQTSAIMIGYEKILLEAKCDLCVVVGDVNSTMACAITAKKMNIKVAHIEAGIRSGDPTMPEEVNRIVTDSLSDWFFTTTKDASINLRRCGINSEKIFFVGNTMIDTLLRSMKRLQKPDFFDTYNLKPQNYLVVTLHRPANVDCREKLMALVQVLSREARGLSLIFPMHPRTKKVFENIKNIPRNLLVVEPQPYLQFNWLIKNAKAVITDSGGISEETTMMGIPCFTLRENTERPETVIVGTNELIGTDPNLFSGHFEVLFANKWKKGGIPDLWDGKSGVRIAAIINDLLRL